MLDDQAGWAAASSIFLASKFRPCARTLQDAGQLIGERNGEYVAAPPQAEVTHVRKDYSRPDQAADRRNWSSVTQHMRHVNEPPAHVLAAIFRSSTMFSCYG